MKKHALVLMLLVAACLAPRAQALTYSIDGNIDDWNVNLETFYYHTYFTSGIYFVQSSFVPDPIGNIKYKVEDYVLSDTKPNGGEYLRLRSGLRGHLAGLDLRRHHRLAPL